MTNLEYLGFAASQLRKAKKISLKEMADLTKYSQTQIFNFENGKVKNPGWFFILEIEKVLGIKMFDIEIEIEKLKKKISPNQKEPDLFIKAQIENWAIFYQKEIF